MARIFGALLRIGSQLNDDLAPRGELEVLESQLAEFRGCVQYARKSLRRAEHSGGAPGSSSSRKRLAWWLAEGLEPAEYRESACPGLPLSLLSILFCPETMDSAEQAAQRYPIACA